MLIPRQRLFTGITNFIGDADTTIADIVKIIVMGRKTPTTIPHWLSMVLSGFEKTANNRKSDPGKIKSISYLFYGIGPKELKDKIGRDTGKQMPATPKDYIIKVWRNIYNQKKTGGVLGYTSLMTSNPTENDLAEIEDKLRYFAYRVTGQMNSNDTWTDVYLTRDPINFTTSIFDRYTYPSMELSKVISSEVRNIVDCLFPGEDILP